MKISEEIRGMIVIREEIKEIRQGLRKINERV